MTTEYAIETIDLIKRYPTRRPTMGRGGGGPGFGGFGGGFGGGRGGAGAGFGLFFDIIRRKKRAYVEALRGVNLQVKKGEIFGLLGPNGAGKTTLIKILCTMVIHDEGEAYVDGIDIKKNPHAVLKVLQAVLPESRGFNWRLTGWQNLYFYALLYGLGKKEAEERINSLLEFTGLTERANDGYQRYSTGMQRKLLLCRALLPESPILLFDEPTAGLDPPSAIEFRNMLSEVAKERDKTVFASTHNLFEAQKMCDRIAIIDQGKIIACDTPDNIRYKAFGEIIVSITFYDANFDEEHKKMLDELEKTKGIHSAAPEINADGIFEGITVHLEKDTDFSSILEVIMKSKLRIKMITSQEPTLEDAFMEITGRHPERRIRRA
jgi:ABC-2 type transport system ATP-binding protein